MARSSVTTVPVVKTGVTQTLAAADVVNGEVIDCGRVVLVVNNSSGSSITVTVHATAVVDGLPVEDLVVTVPAATIKLLGPLSASTFGQASSSPDNGRAYVNYSAACTRGVFLTF